ncbi:MAG: carboxypeptidase regulatory-like domain-containing protein [Kiritimatiellia bacterium]|nr:carboxypeptidase regulatory-like domain-containing protein [Kiritimatiellia bacterium]
MIKKWLEWSSVIGLLYCCLSVIAYLMGGQGRIGEILLVVSLGPLFSIFQYLSAKSIPGANFVYLFLIGFTFGSIFFLGWFLPRRKSRAAYLWRTFNLLLVFVLLFVVFMFFGKYGNKAIVMGHVTDIENKPIAGARLAITDVDSQTKPFHESETQSDAKGRFSLNALSGNSELSVYADGYASMYFIRSVTRGRNRKWNFKLPKSVPISGRVLDTKGKPLSDRVLGVYPVYNGPPSVSDVRFYWSTGRPTDKDGVFNIPGVAPCKHQIIVNHAGYDMLQFPVKGRFIEVNPGDRVEGFEILVNPPEDYAISGHVKDARGKPVRRVYVGTYIPHGSHWWTLTDNEGAFCIEGLDGMGIASFKVNFKGAIRSNGFELVIPDVPLNTKNVDIIVPDKGSIHGIVRNAKTGEMVTNYQVAVPVVRLPDSGAVWEKPQVKVERNPDASFSISNVPAGEATIELRSGGFGTQRFVVLVEAGKSNPLTCEMLGPAVFVGQTTKNGKPRGASIVINGEWVHSDDGGNFRFDTYPNGDYTILFSGWGNGWNHRSADVHLRSGETTRLNMEIGGSCEVRGSIVFPDEESSCMVRLASKPAPPDGWPDSGRPSPEEFVLSYDHVLQSGDEYRLRDIPPGRWYLMAGCHHPFMHRYMLAMSRVIELKDGETLSLDLDLTKNKEQKTER